MVPVYVLSFLLLPLFTSSTPLTPGPIHLPLTRRAPRPYTLESLANAADDVRVKYGYTTVASKLRKRQNTGTVAITNQDGDSSYFASVNVGTPSQAFDVILDTGSSDLWLGSTACQSCSSNTVLYDPTKSTSSKSVVGSTVDIQYGSGQVQGTLVADNVNMGGFTVNQQVFLSVDQTSSGLLTGSVAGIMGLGFQAIAATNALPWWQALLNGGQFGAPEFAFFITRFDNDPQASAIEPGGILTLGGTNSSLYTGDIDFVNMPSGSTPSFWLQSVASLSVHGGSVPIATGDGAIAAIDTGTTLIGGPTADVNSFWSQVPGSVPLTGQNEGYFAYPCTTKLNVSISFGGKSWPINDADMSIGTGGSDLCVGAIFDLGLASSAGGGGGSPNWVIGDTFLKNVYSVYRASPPSVGFAQLSSAAGGSGTPGNGPNSANTGGGNSPFSPSSGSRTRITSLALIIPFLAGSFFL